MSCKTFTSCQAESLSAFVALKHAQGYRYACQRSLLKRFDRLLVERAFTHKWLTRQIIDDFLDQISHNKAFSQSKMLSPIRDYSAYLQLHYPQSHLLRVSPLKPRRPSRFHIYTPAEIRALMRAAESLGPPGAIGGLSIKTLIGLLYVSGLRISEALDLGVDDFDARQGTLFVRKGKFRKERYVPLADTSTEALQSYNRKVQRIRCDRSLLVSAKGTRLATATVGNIFRKLLSQCDIAQAAPWPRLHDLRHTYAVNCLRKWYEQGKDVNAMLPVLSTAMGHVKVSCTQLYLHVPAELREQAAARFSQHIEKHIISER